MKTIYCPALGIESVKKEFDNLVESVGKHKAYELWDKYKGDVPRHYFEQTYNKIIFEESTSSNYTDRTKQNASADVTIAIAFNFDSAGEKATKKHVLEQNKLYLPVSTDVFSSGSDVDMAAGRIAQKLNGLPKNDISLNIAGNGIYTLKDTMKQEAADNFTLELLQKVIQKLQSGKKIVSIRTGGQTGFDEAGAKAGMKLGIPTTILAPKGWKLRNEKGQDVSGEELFKGRFTSNTKAAVKAVKVIPKTQKLPVSEITKANINFGFYNEDPNTVVSEADRVQQEVQRETFKRLFPEEASDAKKLHSFMMLPKMSMVEKEKLAEVFVNTFSEVLDYLSMTGNMANRAIEFKTIVDTNKISDADVAILRTAQAASNPRLEVMEKFGTEKVIEIVKNTMLERKVPEVSVNGILSASERERFRSLKELIITDTKNNYFHHIINMSNSRLKRIEEFIIDVKLMKPVVQEVTPESAIKPDPVIDGVEDANDENTTEDNWMLSYLRRSFVGNLSKEIKTKFSRIVKRDPLTDDIIYNEFGGIEYYNDNDIYNRIMEIIFAQPTIGKQMAALEAMKDTYLWVDDVIDILKSDPIFKTRFFVNFRKDNIQYYKVYRSNNKKGKYTGKVVNYDTLTDKFKEDLVGLAKSGALPLYQPLPETNQLDDRVGVKVNVEELKSILELISTLKKADNVLTHTTTWKSVNEYRDFILGTDTKQGVINPVMEVLHRIGVMGVSRSVLEKVLFNKINIYTTTSLEKSKTPYAQLLTQVEGLLHKVKISGLDPKFGALGGKDNKAEIGAYKNLYREFERFIEQPVEKVIHSNGANYYAYASPNFINRLITKFNSLSNQELVDYIEEEYFDTAIHGRFIDNEKYGKYFTSWLQDIYLDAKSHLEDADQNVKLTERSKFIFTTFLANEEKEFSEMLPSEVIVTALTAYFDSKDAYKCPYMLPIMADKGVSGFITWRKDSTIRTQDNVITYVYKDNIVDKLYGVFMQEVDRINTLRIRRENRKTNQMVPLDKYDLDPHETKFTFRKGDRFVFLPMLQEYFSQVYVKEDKRPVVQVLRKLLTSKSSSEVRMSELIVEENIEIIKEAIRLGLEDEVAFWKSTMSANNDYLTVKRHIMDKEATNTQFEEKLDEFFYNNYYAQTQIMQLTVGDVAFYSNVDDLQKRLAQLRAPGTAYDIDAVNIFDPTTKIPQKFTEDGVQRSIVMSDFMAASQQLHVITKIYDDQLASQLAKLKQKYKIDPKDSAETKAFKKRIVSTTYKSLQLEYKNKLKLFTSEKLNSSDGQSIIGLKTIRKMEGTLGRWSQAKEDLYQKVQTIVLNENISERNKQLEALSYDEFKVIFETRKPFGYGLIKTPALDNTIDSKGRQMNIVRGVQAKDAEAVLLDLFTMLKSGDDFLIELTKLLFTTNLDVIHTASTIKTGVQGIIDVKEYKDTDQFITQIKSLLKDPNSLSYKQNVLEIPLENIVLQVETPSKFEDKNQPIGTQQSKIVFEGLAEMDWVVFQGNKVNARDLERFYEQVNAAKVNKAYETMLMELGITGEIRDLLELNKKTFLQNTSEKAIKARLTMNVTLSKLLLSQMTDSNRFSFDLIMAASLNEAGEFIIPLNDELQFDRIQQLLNAIIKDRLTKQSTAGAQLIQVSDGIRNGEISQSKALQIVWDFDANGNPVSINHLEAELPAYMKSFYEHFMDENGYLHPEWMPEELRNAVAYRIPSEGMCSMMPIRIVRFSNKMNGGIIKLPAEITSITGADFDIDKLFIMYPSVAKDNSVKKNLYSTEGLATTMFGNKSYLEAISDIVNSSDIDLNEITNIKQVYKFLNQQNRSEDIKKVRGLFNRFLTTTNRISEFYYLPSIRINSAQDLNNFATDNTIISTLAGLDDKTLNNTILDINLSVLQNSHNLFSSINPSGFDNLTRITNTISVLREQPNPELKRGIYNSFKELTNDEIAAQKKRVTREPNYFSFGTQVQLHKRNFVGQSLIGIGANGNSSHAILQHYDIKLLPTFDEMPSYVTPLDKLVLNGISIKSLMKNDPKTNLPYIPFSSVYNHTGVIKISNSIREFLAAAVDSAKLPIFEDANINKVTITIAEVILRLGLDLDSTVLLLNQPIMLSFLEYMIKTKGSANGKASNLISGFLDSMKLKDMLVQTKFNSDLFNEDLAENIGISFTDIVTNEQALSNQIQAFKFIIPMIYLSEDTRMLNVEAKQDSLAAAPGPQIADTKAKEGNIEYFNNKVLSYKSFFHPQTAELLNSASPYSSPMLSAYHERTKEASKYIFGVINPMYFYEFSGVLAKLQQDAAEALDKKTIKKLQDDFALFKLFMFDPTNRDNDELALEDETSTSAYTRVIRGHKDATRYYTIEFPKKAAETLIALKNSKEFEKNFFVQSLRLSPAHKNSEMLILNIDSLGMNPDDKRALGTGWADLILGENYDFKTGYTAREFGLELIVFSLYRNGFAFGNRSFLYALSPEIKARLPKYLSYLRNSSTVELTEQEEYQFLNLFKRHNHDLKGVVPTFSTEEINAYYRDITNNKKENKIVSFTSETNLGSIIKVMSNKYDFVLYERTHMAFGENKTYNYRMVTPLGMKAVGKEYTPDMLTSFGHTKKSIYLTNDYGSDLFNKDNLIELNFNDESQSNKVDPDFEGASVSDLSPQVNKISDSFFERMATRLNRDENKIKINLETMLTESFIQKNKLTAQDIEAIRKELEKYC